MCLFANKTPIEVIKEGAFGVTYFINIYSGVIEKWYKNSWNVFNLLKGIDQKYYYSDYYDANKYDVKCGTSLRFLENNEWINEIDPYRWFQWYFTGWVEDRRLILVG